ncbi:hypothetical protein HK405_011151, partial [Cladochytrium tenue]
MEKRFKSNSNKYYFWVVMAIFLQATGAAGDQQKLLLSLAKRMMEKALAEKKFSTLEELQLYLQIREKQGKFEAARAVLVGELGTLRKVETDRKHMLLRYAKLVGTDDGAMFAEELLTEKLERSLQRAIFVRQAARVEILRRCGNLKSARDYESQLDPSLFQID